MKMLPILIMLVAGAFTSVITWLLDYDKTSALWILVGVLVLFYILGLVVQKVIYKFEAEIAEEEARLAEEEGKVVEKEGAAPENGEAEADNQAEGSVSSQEEFQEGTTEE